MSLQYLSTAALLAMVLSVPAAASELDPIVVDVIEMLQSEVDERVILQWLESTGRRPTDVGSQGVIALTQAGATEDLITALLAGVAVGGPVATPEPAREASPESARSPRSDGDAKSRSVEAVIRLRAKQVWSDEEEPDSPREPPWWIYLYLDGEPVAWTVPSLQGEPVEARRVLPVGSHELRVVLQRYEEMRRGWSYESLSVPVPVGFEAQVGGPIEIEFEMKRIWGLWRQRKDGGPLSYLIEQGSEILAEHGGTGGDPDRWQPVCEDVEANFPDPEQEPKRFRDAMVRCVRWAELWNGPGKETDRAAILSRLAEYDFQLPVR